MPKVTTQKARKEYTCQLSGKKIEKGDVYQKIESRFGPNLIAALGMTIPRRYFTTSGYLHQVYNMADHLEIEDQSDLDNLKDEVTSLKDELQDSYDNIPEGLQEGPVGSVMMERIEALEEAADSLDDIEIPELETYHDEAEEKVEYDTVGTGSSEEDQLLEVQEMLHKEHIAFTIGEISDILEGLVIE